MKTGTLRYLTKLFYARRVHPRYRSLLQKSSLSPCNDPNLPQICMTSAGPSSLPGPDASGTAAGTPLRRSKRLQRSEHPAAAENPSVPASTSSPKAGSQPRPKRNAAVNAKPVLSASSQGVSKNKRSITRPRRRK